jgi:hypothetical protein
MKSSRNEHTWFDQIESKAQSLRQLSEWCAFAFWKQ